MEYPCRCLLHLGTDEDTLISHMHGNLNQCRFEGVRFTNTPASKHLINYQLPQTPVTTFGDLKLLYALCHESTSRSELRFYKPLNW